MNPRTEKAIKEFLELAKSPSAIVEVDYLHAFPNNRTVKVGLIATVGSRCSVVEIDLKQVIAKRYPRKKKEVRK